MSNQSAETSPPLRTSVSTNGASKHRPQYVRIADELETRILQGVYKVNDALPTFNSLSDEFEVSLVTVNRAIQALDERGRVIRQRGKGVFAAPLKDTTTPAAPKREVSKTTRTIGLVIPDLSNPFFSSMAIGIQSILHAENYSVMTQGTDGSLRRWDQYLRRLLEDRVDGIIMAPLDAGGTEWEESLWRLKIAKIPFLYLNSKLDRVPSDYVIVDTDHGVREVVRHLVESGHKRLACVSAEPCVKITRHKMNVFIQEVRARGLTISEDDVVVGSKEHDEGGKEAAMRLLSRASYERPTAIFATNDIIAFGVLGAANALNLSIPNDVSVVGFDNIEATRFTSPPLTTVSQPNDEMAAQAAQILLQRIENKLDPDFRQSVFLPSLVERGSCKKLNEG